MFYLIHNTSNSFCFFLKTSDMHLSLRKFPLLRKYNVIELQDAKAAVAGSIILCGFSLSVV